MSAPSTYTLTIQVRPEDIDQQGHVNNVAFVRYVQDAAVAHWLAVASPRLQAEFGWVVRRHEIDYLRPGSPGDELSVRTWVGEPGGAKWDRFTEISRVADGKVLVKARTVWVLLDAATGRPRRIEASLIDRLGAGDADRVPSEHE